MSARDRSITVTTLRRDAVAVAALRLEVTSNDGTRREVPLGLVTLTVGSSQECDVVLDDPEVSRHHCSLTLTEEGVMVRDLGSKNGTFIGGVEIRVALLEPASELTVGSSRLTLRRVGAPLEVSISPAARFGGALGGSLRMRLLFATLAQAAASEETVLLVGESGTGKELLASGVHQASPRASGPFVVFDCAAVAPGLVESELFGHVRGAFTGADRNHVGLLERAEGGTLFVDELGELPLEVQPKLLRALEERRVRPVGTAEYRSVDVRIVAATHRDLLSRVRERQFREDLYYRVAVVHVQVPPLRERKEDIELLVESFLAARQPALGLHDLPAGTLALLKAHDWPGNVRELRNAVARIVLFGALGAPSGRASPAPSGASPELAAPPFSAASVTALPLREARDLVVAHFEEQYVRAKLREQGGNVTRAAVAMGVSRQFLHRLIERYSIRGAG
jgi:DNA-binding NtrC family response regulator